MDTMEIEIKSVPYETLSDDNSVNSPEKSGPVKRWRFAVVILMSIAVVGVILYLIYGPLSLSSAHTTATYDASIKLSKRSTNRTATALNILSKYYTHYKYEYSADCNCGQSGCCVDSCSSQQKEDNGCNSPAVLDNCDIPDKNGHFTCNPYGYYDSNYYYNRRLAVDEMADTHDVAYFAPVMIGDQSFNVSFDTGTSNLWVYGSENVTGAIYNGILKFGGLEVNTTVDVIDQDSAGMADTSDGIMGLSFKSSVFDALSEANAVQRKMFAFYISNVESVSSELIIGGYSNDHFQGDIQWTGITHDEYFQVNCAQMSSNGYEVELSSTNCIIDSGTEKISGPAEDIVQLWNNVFSKYPFVTVHYDSDVDGLIFITDCNSLSLLPNVDITINDRVFTITPNEYVKQVDDNCYFTFAHTDNFDGWILGQTFMKKYYTIFDIQQKRMGFATAK